MREIRGRQPADPRHDEVSTATARAMVARQWLVVVVWVGVAFTTAGQLSSPRPGVVHAFGVLAAVFLVLAAVQTIADSRRARRFLDHHDAAGVVDAGSLGDGGEKRSTA